MNLVQVLSLGDTLRVPTIGLPAAVVAGVYTLVWTKLLTLPMVGLLSPTLTPVLDSTLAVSVILLLATMRLLTLLRASQGSIVQLSALASIACVQCAPGELGTLDIGALLHLGALAAIGAKIVARVVVAPVLVALVIAIWLLVRVHLFIIIWLLVGTLVLVRWFGGGLVVVVVFGRGGRLFMVIVVAVAVVVVSRVHTASIHAVCLADRSTSAARHFLPRCLVSGRTACVHLGGVRVTAFVEEVVGVAVFAFVAVGRLVRLLEAAEGRGRGSKGEGSEEESRLHSLLRCSSGLFLL
ncbi:hypothetical protein BC830DRAFT_412759, partial [Chytriomyces sp. MP71]